MALAVLHYIFKSVAVRFFKDLTEKYPGSLYIYDHLYLKRTKQLASQRKLIWKSWKRHFHGGQQANFPSLLGIFYPYFLYISEIRLFVTGCS